MGEYLSSEVHLIPPLKDKDIARLRIGDVIYVNGIIYTARDLAHIRIAEYVKNKKSLPMDFKGGIVFHAGPAVKRKNGGWEVVGIGPTSSIRMEPFSELMFGKLGVKAVIGKGGMGKTTSEALKMYLGVYLLAPPGCSAILSQYIKRVIDVYWLDLGVPEAVWVLEVEDFGPLIVAMDSYGGDLFEEIRNRARKSMDLVLR